MIPSRARGRAAAKEALMATRHTVIHWKKDVDLALAEARAIGKAVLLDFNAAPM